MPTQFRQKGFTIIELIVVVAIIAVLGAIITASVVQYFQKSKDARVEADMREMEIAAKIDKANTGVWAPDTYSPGANENPCFVDPVGALDCQAGETATYKGSFDGTWYNPDSSFDWQNWGPQPETPGTDCVFIDFSNGESITRRCISIAGCPDACDPGSY